MQFILPFTATSIFKKIEESKILIGNHSQTDVAVKSGIDQSIDDIVELLLNIDVVQRQLTNLTHKIDNPDEAFPLVYGTCVCNGEIDCGCDDLTCLGCDTFIVNCNKIGQIDDFLKRVFRQKWIRDKKGIYMPNFENRIKKIAQRVYVQQAGMTVLEAEQHLEKLKRAVTPGRGRPKREEKKID